MITASTNMRRMFTLLDNSVLLMKRSGTLFLCGLLRPRQPCYVLECRATESRCDVEGRSFSEGGGIQYIEYDSLAKYIRTGESSAIMQNTNRYIYIDHMIKYDDQHVLPPISANQIRL